MRTGQIQTAISQVLGQVARVVNRSGAFGGASSTLRSHATTKLSQIMAYGHLFHNRMHIEQPLCLHSRFNIMSHGNSRLAPLSSRYPALAAVAPLGAVLAAVEEQV